MPSENFPQEHPIPGPGDESKYKKVTKRPGPPPSGESCRSRPDGESSSRRLPMGPPELTDEDDCHAAIESELAWTEAMQVVLQITPNEMDRQDIDATVTEATATRTGVCQHCRSELPDGNRRIVLCPNCKSPSERVAIESDGPSLSAVTDQESKIEQAQQCDESGEAKSPTRKQVSDGATEAGMPPSAIWICVAILLFLGASWWELSSQTQQSRESFSNDDDPTTSANASLPIASTRDKIEVSVQDFRPELKTEDVTPNHEIDTPHEYLDARSDNHGVHFMEPATPPIHETKSVAHQPLEKLLSVAEESVTQGDAGPSGAEQRIIDLLITNKAVVKLNKDGYAIEVECGRKYLYAPRQPYEVVGRSYLAPSRSGMEELKQLQKLTVLKLHRYNLEDIWRDILAMNNLKTLHIDCERSEVTHSNLRRIRPDLEVKYFSPQ